LKPSDSLSKSLLQITGSEHLPYNDEKWRELLLNYETLVHLHNLGALSTSAGEEDVVGNACRQCAKYSSTSSNLAAFCLHVARMIRELQSSLETYTVKQRISLIGKARVACGSLNLLRLLSHETIVQVCTPSTENVEYNIDYTLSACFTYRNQGEEDRDAAMDIVASIMSFLSSIGGMMQRDNDGENSDILAIPEIYDIIVHILSLLLVLLSTQLYQPMVSSEELAIEGQQSNNLFLEKIMQYATWQNQQQQAQNLPGEADTLQNESLMFLHVCLNWLIDRPQPPRRSIASHYIELPKDIAKQMTNMRISSDGMYETHSIVFASAPQGGDSMASNIAASQKKSLDTPASQVSVGADNNNAAHTSIELGTDDNVNLSSAGHISGDVNNSTNMIFHPLRSLLMLSSTFFLLPIRLVQLAVRALGHRAITGGSIGNNSSSDKLILQQIQAHCEKETGWNKTNNILWITDCPIADMSLALLLILSNNCRAQNQNPFRAELASLTDNRWNSKAANSQSTDENSLFLQPQPTVNGEQLSVLSINYESLFKAFGQIAHTEVGALLLYTMLLSSPTLATSISARSDLDTLIMPLLRSLYFSTVMTGSASTVTNSSGQLSQLITLAPSNRPFRSQSQLYLILILLLIFSSDPSFGRDSFRRVSVSITSLKWYKERQIKESSLGSMILLVLLRATSFNLNQLQDAFLLSNCCAVMLNLSPHVVRLSDYAASRLVSVTTSCFKRYITLLAENGGEVEVEGDLQTSLGMHGETCRTLLQLIRHAIRRKYLEKNIHVVYALLLEQGIFQKMCHCKCIYIELYVVYHICYGDTYDSAHLSIMCI